MKITFPNLIEEESKHLLTIGEIKENRINKQVAKEFSTAVVSGGLNMFIKNPMKEQYVP